MDANAQQQTKPIMTGLPAYGHTLPELIVGLAILAILASAAVPSLYRMVQGDRLTTASNSLATSLHYARNEAIKRKATILVCKGTPEEGCSNARDWHQGWIVFIDANQNKRLDDGEDILWNAAALGNNIRLSCAAFPSSSYTSFYPNGSSSSNGTFTFCDRHGKLPPRALILANTGRVRSANRTASDGPLLCPD